MNSHLRALFLKTPAVTASVCAFTVLFLGPARSHATVPAQAAQNQAVSRQFSEISSQLCIEDPRLSVRVDLALSPRIAMPDLLKQLSQATGVSLSVGNAKAENGRVQFCALLRHASLREAINGILSIMSYKHARWTVLRTAGPDGIYMYKLRPSAGTDAMVADIKAQIRQQFRNEAGVLKNALAMSSDALTAAAKNDSDVAYLLPNPEFQDAVDRNHAFLGAFFSLPQAQQDQLMNGIGPVSAPVSSFPPDVQAYLAKKGDINDKSFTFVTQGILGITPALCGGISGGLICNFIGGGLREQEWGNNIAQLWNLPDDSAAGPAMGDRRLKAPNPDALFPDAFKNDPDIALLTLLWKTSAGAPVSILARLSYRGEPEPGAIHSTMTVAGGEMPNFIHESPYGKTLAEVLHGLEVVASLRSKWRDGVLLIANPMTPFTGDSGAIYQ